MSLITYLKQNNCNITEGYSQSCYNQVIILQVLCSDKNIKNILEIGFNAGHSANLFLNTNTKCNVLSFDIGEHLQRCVFLFFLSYFCFLFLLIFAANKNKHINKGKT